MLIFFLDQFRLGLKRNNLTLLPSFLPQVFAPAAVRMIVVQAGSVLSQLSLEDDLFLSLLLL